MAVLIHTDGRMEQVHPAKKSGFTYDELSAAVQGMIEAVPFKSKGVLIVQGEAVEITRRHFMYANEEGHLLGMDYNPQASVIAGRMIVGPVLITTGRK